MGEEELVELGFLPKEDDDGKQDAVTPLGGGGRAMSLKPLQRLMGCFYFDESGVRHEGHHPGLSGNVSGLSGDVSRLSGDVSGLLTGNVSGLTGNVSGLTGNCDAIPLSERTTHPDIAHWVEEDGR